MKKSKSIWVNTFLLLILFVVSPSYAYANTPPRNLTSIPTIKVNEDSEGSSMNLATYFNDTEQNSSALLYSVISNSNSTLVNKTTISGSTLTLGFGRDLSGKAIIKVRATDNGGLFVESNINVFVVPVNDRPTNTGLPVINIPGTTRTATLNLTQYFSDKEDASNKLKYSIVGISKQNLISSTTVDPATGILTINASPNASGEVTLTLRATDTYGAYLERASNRSGFKVYANFIGEKGITYPDPATLGIPEVQLLTNFYFLDRVNDEYQMDHLSETQWKDSLHNHVERDGRPLIVNIEDEQYWGNDPAGRDRLAKLMHIAHQERPDIKTIGFYRLLPERNWFTPVRYRRMQHSLSLKLLDYYTTSTMQQQAPVDYASWQTRNSLYRTATVSSASGGGTVYQKVDHTYPSLYTFYRDTITNFKYSPVTIDPVANTITSSFMPYTDGAQIQFVRIQDGQVPTGAVLYKYYTVTNSTFVGQGSRFQIINPDTNTVVDFQSSGIGQQYMFTKGPWENLWEDGAVWEWSLFAEENVIEARKYGKPVYPYISPSMLGDGKVFLEKEFFRYQLDVLYDLKVPGVVIYESGEKGATFYQNQPWWRALSEFMTWLDGPLTTLTVNIAPSNLAPKNPQNLRILN